MTEFFITAAVFLAFGLFIRNRIRKAKASAATGTPSGGGSSTGTKPRKQVR
ncbi:hypothetical protein GUF72_04450 [Xanthomonas citri pv. citri]|uniref:Uncharacterized protein n=3 Tax=Xanthomonas citri TaxID=346 RepID=A0A7U2LXB7_XANCI|nr:MULTISPECIES: hypothetical protein [Xanthomonas]AGI06915.1 Hypothetical Protein XCAW_01105 [Xanthomonas citri subsp. citri Aw12879]AJD67653.1 hypothetical protein J151_01195 [Xanthomonas citri subsp. citri A306]AJY81187.1 hypothetical protein J159_01192 [Xanthomonas citri pv. citri]AJY85609.1 hypothetical protein J158_01192 [Xanthomonas citri subsp. citri UI6]AJY90032.1 hypothetical protein J169_01191 [Xanthomonas citri pv. citri]